jgi:hypothetical protein
VTRSTRDRQVASPRARPQSRNQRSQTNTCQRKPWLVDRSGWGDHAAEDQAPDEDVDSAVEDEERARSRAQEDEQSPHDAGAPRPNQSQGEPSPDRSQ